MSQTQSRRRFLTTLSAAGAASLVRTSPAIAEDGLETKTVRIAHLPGICIAPQYVAEELLRAEGFTDVRYVRLAPGSNTPEGIASGEVDFGINFASVLVSALDQGVEMTVLGGVHVGCFELFVNEESRSLIELKGKRVGVTYLGSPGHLFLAAMAAQVGIDPAKDLRWVLCHEHHRSERRCGTVREMKEGPSGSAIRSLIPSHRKLLWSKVTVVSVAETPGR